MPILLNLLALLTLTKLILQHNAMNGVFYLAAGAIILTAAMVTLQTQGFALIFSIVYVGAVAILFLFVTMLLNFKARLLDSLAFLNLQRKYLVVCFTIFFMSLILAHHLTGTNMINSIDPEAGSLPSGVITDVNLSQTFLAFVTLYGKDSGIFLSLAFILMAALLVSLSLSTLPAVRFTPASVVLAPSWVQLFWFHPVSIFVRNLVRTYSDPRHVYISLTNIIKFLQSSLVSGPIDHYGVFFFIYMCYLSGSFITQEPNYSLLLLIAGGGLKMKNQVEVVNANTHIRNNHPLYTGSVSLLLSFSFGLFYLFFLSAYNKSNLPLYATLGCSLSLAFVLTLILTALIVLECYNGVWYLAKDGILMSVFITLWWFIPVLLLNIGNLILTYPVQQLKVVATAVVSSAATATPPAYSGITFWGDVIGFTVTALVFQDFFGTPPAPLTSIEVGIIYLFIIGPSVRLVNLFIALGPSDAWNVLFPKPVPTVVTPVNPIITPLVEPTLLVSIDLYTSVPLIFSDVTSFLPYWIDWIS